MARAKRTAERRSTAAIAEDLRQAREVGGLLRADESDLSATSDLLVLTGVGSEESLLRARDLLISYVRRGCALHRIGSPDDKTGQAAADSLQLLLNRPTDDRQLTRRVREQAAKALGHAVSADAIRKREDKIIDEVAEAVLLDLKSRLEDAPPTLEAAIHRLIPTLADLRQDLHDLLILNYFKRPPADPQEQRIIDEHYRRTVLRAARVMVLCEQLFRAGLNGGAKSYDEHWFMARASSLRNHLFREGDDRSFVRDFTSRDSCNVDRGCEHLTESEPGKVLHARWVAWTGSCYPTCAFERTWDQDEMCSPHAFVTDAYGAELQYLESGLQPVVVPGNDPIILHPRAGER